MVGFSYCDYCKHYRGLRDNWKPTCDAFPEGIPVEHEENVEKECNAGIRFELKEGEQCSFLKINPCND